MLFLFAAPFAAGQPPRFANGVLLLFEPAGLRVLAKPVDAAGEPRAFSIGEALASYDALLVRDFVARRDGRLAVSVSGAMPGRDGMDNLILHFALNDPGRPAKFASTGPVNCAHLAEAEGRLWCLGPDQPALMRGQDYGVLYRLDEDTMRPRPVLKRGELPRVAEHSPWGPRSQLVAGGNGELLALMPGVRRMARVAGGRVRLDELPWDPRPQSLVSTALDEQGRLHALLPLAGADTFVTPYAVFRRDGRKWVRLTGDGIPRGARLLAVEGAEALIADRLERLLRVPLVAED